MAGDWLKMECCLPEKPEVFQIAGIMGIDPDEVFGKLFKVWRWFDAHTETGNAHSVTYALVDRVAGVTGFAEAMAFVGWLVQDGRDLVIPNFERHNGKTAKDRGLTAKRVAKNKAKGNAPVTPAPLPDALPREEKRREEKEQEQGGASPAPPACPHSEIVALYHEVLPELARVKDWTEERQAHLRSRWREDPKRQTLDYWRRYFGHVAASEFLMGRAPPKPGSKPFAADLEWLVRKSNFIKVIEGKYHDRA